MVKSWQLWISWGFAVEILKDGYRRFVKLMNCAERLSTGYAVAKGGEPSYWRRHPSGSCVKGEPSAHAKWVWLYSRSIDSISLCSSNGCHVPLSLVTVTKASPPADFGFMCCWNRA